jgi:hypothetical protein
MKQITMPIVGVITVVALAAGFGGGYFFKGYQQMKLRGSFVNGQFGGAQRFNGARMGGQNGGMMRDGATGTVLSMDDKSITIKLVDGSSKIVLFSDTTKYTNTKDATKTDLKVGAEVAAFGTPNSDGSVTAVNIQINPVSFRPSPSPTATPGK